MSTKKVVTKITRETFPNNVCVCLTSEFARVTRYSCSEREAPLEATVYPTVAETQDNQ